MKKLTICFALCCVLLSAGDWKTALADTTGIYELTSPFKGSIIAELNSVY